MASTQTHQTHTSDELENLYKSKVIPAGITASGKTKEIVDIITAYPWSAQTISSKQGTNGSVSFTHNLPYCYAIERQLTVGANVTSVINALIGNTDAIVKSADRIGENVTGALGKMGEIIGVRKQKEQTPAVKPSDTEVERATAQSNQNEGRASGSGGNAPKKDETTKQESAEDTGAIKKIMSSMSKIANLVEGLINNTDYITKMDEGNLASSVFLYPWRWLYFTKITGKRFIFPTFSSNDLLKMTSQWGDAKNPFSEVTDIIEDWSYKVRTLADITEFLPQSNGTSRYVGYKIEYAKAFMYNPETCQSISSRFVLYNTIKKDAWKQNYRFLMMFLLRNLPIRTSMYAYLPPLLYDIIVPGIKHLPLCYVENIDVTPEGHIRNMQADNILKEIVADVKNKQIQVPVPEAWRIEIKFKCLIPDTMNLILNTTTFPINITTTEGGRDSYKATEQTQEEKKETADDEAKKEATSSTAGQKT